MLFYVLYLFQRPFRKLSPQVQVWKTPGHMQQGLSVIVRNVLNFGTMSIVGNLIPNEEYISEKVL